MTNQQPETHTISNNFLDPKPTSRRRELVNIWVDEVTLRAKTEPGAVFAHIEISNAIGIPYIIDGKTNGTYHNWMQYAKDRLIAKHGLFLESVERVGYCLRLPGEEIEVCKKDYLRGVKKIKKAVTKANHINIATIPAGPKLDATITAVNEMSNKVALLRQSQIEE